MTRKILRTGQVPGPDLGAADRGVRHLVVAGAARIERVEADRAGVAWHHVDREWSRRSSWRTRQHAQEGAADEQQG